MKNMGIVGTAENQVRNILRASRGPRPRTLKASFRVVTDHGCTPVRNITNRDVPEDSRIVPARI